MKKKGREILLSFDVEEFDIPLEYGITVSNDEQMAVGKKGLDTVTEILVAQGIQCTLFTTANFALRFPVPIADLSKKHEIASHTFFHSSFKKEDLRNSREALEDITSKKVFGLRMPRMKKIDSGWIKDAGYTYDSSMNPTWIPDKYNNFFQPRTFYNENGITKFPVSVSANFRVPLFWLAFKNFPYAYYRRIALQSLRNDGYLCIYFHPWEFTDLDSYRLPAMIKRKAGVELVNRLNRLISDLKNEGDFITMNSFIDKTKL